MIRDRILIFSVFIVASCGLVYELIASALSSYLLGDSILQFSSIIGCYLFAMGIGAYLSKYVAENKILDRFIDIELLVGLLGGLSALFLFVLFAWGSASFRVSLYAIVLLVGILVGMEIPLIMRLLNQQKNEFKEIVSRVLTFDYLGALAVSLLFPLVFAPMLGMAKTALLFGILNASIALMTTYIFKSQLGSFSFLNLKCIVVLLGLLCAFFFANKVTDWAEQSYFPDPIILSETTPYQRIVVTKNKTNISLFINNNLQFSSKDEHRYHEALVLPLMQAHPNPKNVLVLGGGDGLAIREILKFSQVESITLVDLDPAMTRLFSTVPEFTKLNQHALSHPKVTVVNEDAAKWLEKQSKKFDAIIMDLPDPSNFALGKLYSVPVFRLIQRHLSPDGLFAIQSTSPYYAPHAFWCVVETLKTAGFQTWPYHTDVPSFGDWGYVLASTEAQFTPPSHYDIPTRYLDGKTSLAMFNFPKDMTPPKVEPNHLNTQILVKYFEQDWGSM